MYSENHKRSKMNKLLHHLYLLTIQLMLLIAILLLTIGWLWSAWIAGLGCLHLAITVYISILVGVSTYNR